MPKLPKNLPALPPVPEGYSRWEKPVMGPLPLPHKVPAAVCVGGTWVVSEDWEGRSSCWYAVAVRDPKPAPKKRKGRVRAVKAAAPTYFASQGELGMGYVVRLKPYRGDIPVYLLPADAASVERMVEQVAVALIKKWGVSNDEDAKVQYHDDARIALAAIGISAKGGRK